MRVIKRLLRYGTRHHVWFPRGYKGRVLPQLNPLESSSHGAGRKRTWSIYEPLWAFRLRNRLFNFAGLQRCGRRDESWQGREETHALPDRWDMGMDDNRTCSYCGSLHPEDMAKLVKRCIDTDAADVRIEPSDKQYKVYVWQKGVMNAGQGGIKFYMQHVSPELLLPASQEQYALAVRLSHAAYKRMTDERVAAMTERMKK